MSSKPQTTKPQASTDRPKQKSTVASKRLSIAAVGITALVAAIVCLGVGAFSVPAQEVFKILTNSIFPGTFEPTWTKQMQSVVLDIRTPRIVGALLVGAALSVSGTLYQAIFKNPLVSPDLLGVSSGACLGASLAILLHWSAFGIQLAALGMGLAAVAITCSIPRLFRNSSNLMLILAGIITSGFMAALQGIVKYVADPEEELASIVYWTMGSLASVKMSALLPCTITILTIIAIVLLFRWRLNLLSLGEKEARAFGVNVARGRALVILAATIMTAVAVCLCGTIGWVGLVVPHMGRLLVGEDNRFLLPASALAGALFMLIVDTVARTISVAEIPLSIVTGLVGAPLFVALLAKQRTRVN